jgi:hypothetical protein
MLTDYQDGHEQDCHDRDYHSACTFDYCSHCQQVQVVLQGSDNCDLEVGLNIP